MPFLPVDTAIQVVVGPLVDDTDFKSIETGVAWNAAGMSVDLIEKGVNSSTKTDLSLTTGGVNDWVELGNGMYSIEITAAQNNTLGTLEVVGIATGILVFMSPSYTVVAVVVYNSLIAGSDNLQVDLVQMGGVTQSATDLKDFADAGYDPGTSKVQGVVLVDTTSVNTDSAAAFVTAQADLDILTGADGVTLATVQGNYAPATVAALATAQLDLDKLTGVDGATLATLQANYAPSIHSAADVVTALFAKNGLTAGGVATYGDITKRLYAMARGQIDATGSAYAFLDDDDATTLYTLTTSDTQRTTA
ncbi:MAG TPA: hypothetical protein VNA25_14170 [Phycisphaerae bacterium]|nr:hypothetical protein [Phycisphaerae bacterium]